MQKEASSSGNIQVLASDMWGGVAGREYGWRVLHVTKIFLRCGQHGKHYNSGSLVSFLSHHGFRERHSRLRHQEPTPTSLRMRRVCKSRSQCAACCKRDAASGSAVRCFPTPISLPKPAIYRPVSAARDCIDVSSCYCETFRTTRVFGQLPRISRPTKGRGVYKY